MPQSPRKICKVCKQKHNNKENYCDAHIQYAPTKFRNKVKHEYSGFYQTKQWKDTRAMYIQANPLCEQCHNAGNVVDHIVPIRKDGHLVDPDNLQTLCTSCHNSKTARGL